MAGHEFRVGRRAVCWRPVFRGRSKWFKGSRDRQAVSCRGPLGGGKPSNARRRPRARTGEETPIYLIREASSARTVPGLILGAFVRSADRERIAADPMHRRTEPLSASVVEAGSSLLAEASGRLVSVEIEQRRLSSKPVQPVSLPHRHNPLRDCPAYASDELEPAAIGNNIAARPAWGSTSHSWPLRRWARSPVATDPSFESAGTSVGLVGASRVANWRGRRLGRRCRW